MPDALPRDIADALRESAASRSPFGDEVHYYAEIGSTNDAAADLAERGAAEGTMVLASAQTAGRGRLGRHWHSPPDAGLYFSLICRNPRAAPLLTLAGGVAVAEGIRRATGLPVEIKWPNDVVVAAGAASNRRRKLAGLLAEASSSREGLQYVVLGIGLNLRPSPLPAPIRDLATSIEAELGRPVDRAAILSEILATLAADYRSLREGRCSDLLDRWRRLAPLATGAPVSYVSSDGRSEGVTAGIAEDGALLVRRGGRIERVIAGEVVWN